MLTNSHVSKIVVWSWSKGCLKGYEQQCKGGHENLQQMDELHLEVSVKVKLVNRDPHPLNTYYHKSVENYDALIIHHFIWKHGIIYKSQV